MTRMTGPDCAVMCNFIIHTHTHTHGLEHKERYNIVIGEEDYIYVLQQVRRDFPLRL